MLFGSIIQIKFLKQPHVFVEKLCKGSFYFKKIEEKKIEPIIADKSLIIGDPVDNILEGHLIFPIGSSYRPMVHNPDVSQYGYQGSFRFKLNNVAAYDVSHGNVGGFDNNAVIEYRNDEESTFDISNILFYNQETRKSYSLTDDTVHILSFAIHKEFKNPQILYRVVKADYNQDSMYNSKDGVMLFSSTLDGKNFTQLTPDNQQYLKYYYYKDKQTVLVKSVIDSDSTLSFDPFDETNFILVDLNKPGIGVALFSDSTKMMLKNQLNIK